MVGAQEKISCGIRFFPLLEENRFAAIENGRKKQGDERYAGMTNFLRPAAIEYTSVRWYQPKTSVMIVLMVDIVQLMSKVDLLNFFLTSHQTLTVGGFAMIISPFSWLFIILSYLARLNSYLTEYHSELVLLNFV